jgi:hypothetical protein
MERPTFYRNKRSCDCGMSGDIRYATAHRQELEIRAGKHQCRGDEVTRRVSVVTRQPPRDSFRPGPIVHSAVNHLLALGEAIHPRSTHALAQWRKLCKLLERQLNENEMLDISGDVVPRDGAWKECRGALNPGVIAYLCRHRRISKGRRCFGGPMVPAQGHDNVKLFTPQQFHLTAFNFTEVGTICTQREKVSQAVWFGGWFVVRNARRNHGHGLAICSEVLPNCRIS